MSVNLGRVAYVEKGAYDGGTTYQKKDVVSYNNGSYVYIADVSAAGIVPTDTAYWQPMLDPASMNQAVATANQAAETANQAANTATTAANAANTAAEAADNARLAIADELNKKAPAIYVDASGDMVHITDGAEGMPVQSLVSHIEPVQSGSGDPSPDNVRPIIGWDEVSVTGARRNLLYHSSEKVEDMTLKNSSGEDISRKGYLVEIPAGDYVIKSEYKEGYTNGTFITGLIVDAGLQNHGKESLRVVNGTAVGTFKFSLEPGEKLALYNGNTSQTVSQTKTTFDRVNLYIFTDDGNTENEEYNGETLTANLPETLYGFDKNWTTGLVTVTHALKTFDGSENWTLYQVTNTGSSFYLPISGKKFGAKSSICSQFANVTGSWNENYKEVHGIYSDHATSGNVYFRPPNDTVKTVEQFKAWLAEQYAAGTPVTLVYKLATPYTIQLTPQQMETLKGTNNIWSDAGATEVTYAADTKLYIDGKIAAIAAAIVNE